MFDFIRSTYKKGDKLKLTCANGEFSGEILFINSDSIILKTLEGKVCGIKGCEISFFEELSVCTSQSPEKVNIKDNKQDQINQVVTNNVCDISTIELSDKELMSSQKERVEVIPEKDKKQLDSNQKGINISQYKTGDVIPLDILHRIDPRTSKPRITKKVKTTQTFNGLESLQVLVENDHKIQNNQYVPALGSVKWISADGRPFGCILDGKENIELYFSFSQIADPYLLKNIKKGASVIYTKSIESLGPKAKIIHSPGKIIDVLNLAIDLAKSGNVKFAIGVVEHILNEYPENFDAEKLLKELKSKVSYHIITNKQPHPTIELYQKAKRLHDSKKYDEAIEAYKEAIKANHKRESAVKDLGMLYLFLCNQAELEEQKESFRLEAIDFMEDNSKYLPQNTVTWSYLENFYYSVREFEKFDRITDKLLANKQIQSEGQRYVFLLNKKAASFLRRGNKNKAKEYVEKSLKVYNEGTAALKLLSIIENDNIDLETVFNASEFETLTSGLSLFIQETLDKYEEYHGVPSKIIESGQFNSVTLNEIRKLIDTAGKARARERAKYLLTEGKLMLTIEPDNILRLRSVMARFCNAMAQNHIFENSSMDITRFYYLEAFSLEEKYKLTANQVALYLLTHCYTYTQLLNASSKTPSVDDALKVFMSGDLDPKKWESLLSMFLYNREISAVITSRLYANSNYLKKAKSALINFGINLHETPSKDDFVSAWNRLREQRIRDYKHSVTSILSYRNITSLEEVCVSLSSNLREERKDWMCALDLGRLISIVNNIAPALDNYIKSSGYRNKEAGYNNARGQIAQLIEEINDGPTRFSYEAIRPLMSYVFDLLENSFNDVIKTSEPRVELKLLSEETVVDDDNLVSIQVSVSNHKDSSPIREVSVVIQDMPGISFIVDNNVSYNAIDGGELSIFRLRLKINDEIRKFKATPLKAICKYKSGNSVIEKAYDLSLKLYSPSDFTEIDNPYSPIADGGPVPVTSNMFYGREGFISDVAKSILNSPSKQIIIYGQKRCGKSSVMLHLKKTLMETNRMFCIFFSMGDIINNLSEASFYYKILNTIKTELEFIEFDGGIIPEFEIPSYVDFKNEDEDNPLNTFTKYVIKFKLSCKKTDGWQDKNLVVMIDEFTYLYTEIKKGKISPSIMKQWKAVTQNERAQFSVILVGQDVVPSFKKEEYASNAFGVIQDIRLTYLEEQPARELIEKPILDANKESRYIGNAVTRILEYTSRNPYYIQIFCARLVDFMNKNKSIKVTEADINEVARSFVVGDQALEIDKFDNLIRAGESEDLQEVPEVEIITILRQIALATKNIPYCKRADISTDYGEEEENRVLQHLEDREVLEKKGDDNYKIQVKLFQEWLLNH